MAHILVVDDNAEVLGTIWRALSREGHEITLAESAKQAYDRISKRKPDLIVLDIIMPHKTGLEFCQEIRQKPELETIPVLFLSAKVRTDDIVRGLDAGGDDYLIKPFELNELNARVRALLRRSKPSSQQSKIITVGDLKLDSHTFQVSTPKAENIQLTSTEYRLLFHLMSTPNQVHSVRELLDVVWQYPDGAGDPDLVRAHVRNLRAKIEENSRRPRYIHTIHGVGYMIKDGS